MLLAEDLLDEFLTLINVAGFGEFDKFAVILVVFDRGFIEFPQYSLVDTFHLDTQIPHTFDIGFGISGNKRAASPGLITTLAILLILLVFKVNGRMYIEHQLNQSS